MTISDLKVLSAVSEAAHRAISSETGCCSGGALRIQRLEKAARRVGKNGQAPFGKFQTGG